jgi:hypothetical protein
MNEARSRLSLYFSDSPSLLAPSTPPREFLKENPPKRPIQTFRSKAPMASSFSRNYNNASVPDAYAFGSSDPDEEWSTLPSRKRMKPKSMIDFPLFYLRQLNSYL